MTEAATLPLQQNFVAVGNIFVFVKILKNTNGNKNNKNNKKKNRNRKNNKKKKNGKRERQGNKTWGY